jgi:hypothetical protein
LLPIPAIVGIFANVPPGVPGGLGLPLKAIDVAKGLSAENEEEGLKELQNGAQLIVGILGIASSGMVAQGLGTVTPIEALASLPGGYCHSWRGGDSGFGRDHMDG